MYTVLRGVVAIISAVVLVGCASSAPGPSGNSLQNQLVADVSGKDAFPHLEALQRIADNNGGHRASPGPGYDASVDYVAGILRDAGRPARSSTGASTRPAIG